jgi:hypothetical protein
MPTPPAPLPARRRWPAPLVAGAVAAALSGGAAPAVAASAASAAAPSPTGQRSVTVVLAAPDPARLHALATATGLSRRERVARLAGLRPGAGQRAAVAEALTGAGLRVTAGDTWTVTASGPAARVAAAFGTPRERGGRFARSLPRRPARIAALSAAVFGGGETRPARRHSGSRASGVWAGGYGQAGLTGPQVLARYAPAAPLPPVAPGAAVQTIATVQFQGWDPADLTRYAAAAGLPDPVRSGQYTGIGVLGKDPRQIEGTDGGDLEVALDQQALLGVAPAARQRAYFGPNSNEGSLAMLHRIAADATSATARFHGLVAVSISWGLCEDWADAQTLAAENQAYAELAAAGLTVFAASGDAGSQDCEGTPSVDFPASSPYVVGVGGTEVAGGVDVGWDDGPGAASGGGASKVFGRPSWQTGVGSWPATRLVPDIAGLAGAPRLSVHHARSGGWLGVGGTSLAAPLNAAMLTDELIRAGRRDGLGDIHPALYEARALTGPSGYVDITTGSNGGYAAGAGWDPVTGLGLPMWNRLADALLATPRLAAVAGVNRSSIVPVTVTVPDGVSYAGWRTGNTRLAPACTGPWSPTPPTRIDAGGTGARTLWVAALLPGPPARCVYAKVAVMVDQTPPVVSATASLPAADRPLLALRWSATDPVGVAGYDVTVTRTGTAAPVWSARATTATGVDLTGEPGAGYQLSVLARDRVGNASRPAVAEVLVPLDDRVFRFRGAWSRDVASWLWLGSAARAGAGGARAEGSVAGSQLGLLVTKRPDGGRAAVYVDGRLTAVVDTYAPVTAARQTVPLGSFPAGTHTVVVGVLGTAQPGSRGVQVQLDGLVRRL